jgi:hypothetical protein
MSVTGITTRHFKPVTCNTTWIRITKREAGVVTLGSEIGGEVIVSQKRGFFGLGRVVAVGVRKPNPGRNCSTCEIDCLLRKER